MFRKFKKISVWLIISTCFFTISCAEKSKSVNFNEAVQKQDVNALVSIIKKPMRTPADVSNHNHAIKALGEIRGPDVVEPLIAVLKDENLEVRSAAAKALGEIGDARAVRPLLSMVKFRDSKIPRPEIAALQKIGNPAVDILLEELQNEDPKVRMWAAAALSMIGEERSVGPVISTLGKETDPDSQKTMLNSLLSWKGLKGAEDPRIVDVCIALLNTEIPKARETAAKLVLKSTNSNAVKVHADALIVLVNSDNSELRLQAAKSLMKLDDPKAKNYHEQAKRIIDEQTFITEWIFCDEFGRGGLKVLYNSENKQVAAKKFFFSSFNNDLISKEIISDESESRIIAEFEYDRYGRNLNAKFLCLDKKGDLLKKGGKAALVNSFNAEQKRDTKVNYKGFSKIKSSSVTTIYPCKNCSAATETKDCVYVW